ncbi:MAG TPA: protein-L-isoaspartate(D-aspartate) O-methyltransferase [Planctomycetaceae bacterium]|nr:protein-L-isoaspartate(D-aspartate) O-methyltransferase [Planctomycetaceae bacterium]
MNDPRRALVHELEHDGIVDRRVLDVIERTPRERFMPSALAEQAYENRALPIGEGQTISQPYIVALMTQELRLHGNETVLEIGTGSGYQTAILAQLCRRVVSVERLGTLAATAQPVLAELGIANVEFHVGDGTLGWPASAPYDGIIVTAAAPRVPPALYAQLTEQGRMVIPVGDLASQELQLVIRTREGPAVRDLCPCRFVRLIGVEGWPESAPDE